MNICKPKNENIDDISDYTEMNKKIKDLYFAIYDYDTALDMLHFECANFFNFYEDMKERQPQIISSNDTMTNIDLYLGIMKSEERKVFFSWCVKSLIYD